MDLLNMDVGLPEECEPVDECGSTGISESDQELGRLAERHR